VKAKTKMRARAADKPVKKADKPVKKTVGWREWVSLPALDVPRIKAKIDTGARTSAMHAWDIQPFESDGQQWVSFEVHPFQRNNREILRCAALVVDRRSVRSSSGHKEYRYVISTDMMIGGVLHSVEITLTNRDQMGFRLLLGRTAMRGYYLVDPQRSFILREKQVPRIQTLPGG